MSVNELGKTVETSFGKKKKKTGLYSLFEAEWVTTHGHIW
jgi:hypothetical protein